MMIDVDEFSGFLKKQNYSKNSILSYRKSLLNFADFVGSRPVTKELLYEYRESLMDNNAPATVNLRLNAVHRWLRMQGYNVKIKGVRQEQRSYLDNVITMNDYLHLLSCLAKDEAWLLYVFVRLLAVTGLRISEMMQVRYDHLTAGYIDLIHTKNNRCRRVFIPEKVCEEILALLSDDAVRRQFPEGFGLFIRDDQRLDTAIRYYQNRLYRCAFKYRLDKNVLHPHSFRHFFAKNFLRHNTDIVLLADLLGHSKIETTRIYLRQTRSEQKEMINQIVDW